MPQNTKEERAEYYETVCKPRMAKRRIEERAQYLKLLHQGLKISEEQRKYMNKHYRIEDE